MPLLAERHTRMGIPAGEYCYEVRAPIYRVAANGERYVVGHQIRSCPFWYGTRPNGGCLVHGWDPALGDACKACGWRQAPPDHQDEDLC